MTRRQEGWTAAALFVGSIWLANYLIGHVGTVCPADGPCLVPVWPGVMAPSGVLAIGLSFTLRDLVQRRLGRGIAMAAIVAGAGLSATLSPQLALASGTAFLLSETMDLLVYTPLQARHLVLATVASNIVGLVVDSAVFLFLAFGSLQFIGGQVIGKAWMTVVALPLVAYLRRREARKEAS
ncbi:MAG: VUT family protein [Firmicutes bacterium]|nr:VUT family protein [Bacillota bacterium]